MNHVASPPVWLCSRRTALDIPEVPFRIAARALVNLRHVIAPTYIDVVMRSVSRFRSQRARLSPNPRRNAYEPRRVNHILTTCTARLNDGVHPTYAGATTPHLRIATYGRAPKERHVRKVGA